MCVKKVQRLQKRLGTIHVATVAVHTPNVHIIIMRHKKNTMAVKHSGLMFKNEVKSREVMQLINYLELVAIDLITLFTPPCLPVRSETIIVSLLQ